MVPSIVRALARKKIIWFGIGSTAIVFGGAFKYNEMKNYLKENNMVILQDADVYSFVNRFDSLDKTRDVIIKINHIGGSFEHHMWVAKHILANKGPGKLIAHVPHYALSAGCMIMLTCDEIIVTKSTAISPSDPMLVQNPWLISGRTVLDYYEEKKNLTYESIATSSYYKLTKSYFEECKELVKELGVSHKWTAETQKKIYEEIFSGKHPHNRIFPLKELLNMGIVIKIDNLNRLSIPWFLRGEFIWSKLFLYS